MVEVQLLFHWLMSHVYPNSTRFQGLAPDVQSFKLLDLVAIDATVVAMNINAGLNHTIWAQGPLQEMKKPLG